MVDKEEPEKRKKADSGGDKTGSDKAASRSSGAISKDRSAADTPSESPPAATGSVTSRPVTTKPETVEKKTTVPKPEVVKAASAGRTESVSNTPEGSPATAKTPGTEDDKPIQKQEPVVSGPGSTKPENAGAEPAAPDTPVKPGAPIKAGALAEPVSSERTTSVPKTTTAKSLHTAEKAAHTTDSSNKTTSGADKAAPPAASMPAPPRQTGFFPLLLGGVCAAAIGFGAAYYILPAMGLITSENSTSTDLLAQLNDQSRRLTALQEQLDAIPAPPETPDFSGLETAQQQLEQHIDTLAQQISDFDTRIGALESQQPAESQQPVAGGDSVPSEQLSALREALTAQAAQIDTQAAQIATHSDLIDTQSARMDALSAEAQQREEGERAAAQQDLRRAVLARIRAALDTGSGFAPALSDLERAGISVPAALQTVAEDGVATQAGLRDSYAPAARAALAKARRSAPESEKDSGLWSFVSDQLGVRSLERRDGPGADAVLSRAEDDVRQGRLDSALNEIGSLPELVQAEMADWSRAARARMQALAAFDALAAKLN